MKVTFTKKKAQSLIEYALILAMVAVIAIAALQLLGNNIGTTLKNAANSVGQGADSAGENACDAMGEDFQWVAATANTGAYCRYKNGASSQGESSSGSSSESSSESTGG